jgi:hypothetical protein
MRRAVRRSPDDGGAMLDRLGRVAAQASAPGQQLVGRQRAQLFAQALGCVDGQRFQVVDRARPRPHRAVAGGQQHAHGLPVATPTWLGRVVAAQRLVGRSNGVQVIGLGAVVAACRPSRTVELNHTLAVLERAGGEAGAVAAGASIAQTRRPGARWTANQ